MEETKDRDHGEEKEYDRFETFLYTHRKRTEIAAAQQNNTKVHIIKFENIIVRRETRTIFKQFYSPTHQAPLVHNNNNNKALDTTQQQLLMLMLCPPNNNNITTILHGYDYNS